MNRTLNLFLGRNPILSHEWRTRWRGRRAFALLLGYNALLCVAMLLSYSDSVEGQAGIAGTARAGRELFIQLTLLQLAGWLLLSPGLTAGGIAGERERGLLESLQLSPLRPHQIVLGKLASSLLFVALIILVSQPVVGICFLLGGVSENEYLTSLGLQFLTAFFGAGIGTYFSAVNRRAGAALRKAFAVIIIWSIASLIAFTMLGFPGVNAFWNTTRFVTALSHPVSIAYLVFDSPRLFTTFPAPLVLFEAKPWLFTLIFQVVFLSLALLAASRAVRRPLPEQFWIEAKPRPETAISSSTQATGLSSPHATKTVSATKAAALWWELPFARLKFKNPLLERELRGKFRMRAVPPVVLAAEALLALAVAYFYVRAVLWAVFEPSSREAIWWVISYISLLVLLIAVPVMGATAFTRERESGTFEGLFLSLLSNREIVIAKIGAPLLSSVLYGLPLLPLMILCVRMFSYHSNSSALGISATQAIGTFLVLLSSAFSCGAFGMLISWYCRRTGAAIGWTLGGLFGIFAVAPVLWLIATNGSPGTLWISHPIYALSSVGSPRSVSDIFDVADPIVPALLFALLHYAVGCLLLVILQHAMQHRARETNKK